MDSVISPPRRRGRPPKRGESPFDTRELLLRAGVEALTAKGFSATGIDEILRRVGVPKGSFYHHFKDKEDCALKVIDADIAEVLVAKGFDIDRSAIRMPEGPLKQVGETSLEVSLHADVLASITVVVKAEQ